MQTLEQKLEEFIKSRPLKIELKRLAGLLEINQQQLHLVLYDLKIGKSTWKGKEYLTEVNFARFVREYKTHSLMMYLEERKIENQKIALNRAVRTLEKHGTIKLSDPVDGSFIFTPHRPEEMGFLNPEVAGITEETALTTAIVN